MTYIYTTCFLLQFNDFFLYLNGATQQISGYYLLLQIGRVQGRSILLFCTALFLLLVLRCAYRAIVVFEIEV